MSVENIQNSTVYNIREVQKKGERGVLTVCLNQREIGNSNFEISASKAYCFQQVYHSIHLSHTFGHPIFDMPSVLTHTD